jgi:SAM-dependent methyltransferase
MFGVVEHLHESPRRVFADIARSLTPGGHLVIETPNHAWLRTRLRLLFGQSANHALSDWWQEPFFGHIREYTLPELRAMFEWSGFETRLATTGNWVHVPSRLRSSTAGEPDRWTTRFTLDSIERLVVAGSLCVTALVPSLRYTALIIGRRK